jgi:hypothetical protein
LWKCGSMELGGAAKPTLISVAPNGERRLAAANAVTMAVALTKRMSAILPLSVRYSATKS